MRSFSHTSLFDEGKTLYSRYNVSRDYIRYKRYKFGKKNKNTLVYFIFYSSMLQSVPLLTSVADVQFTRSCITLQY